MDKISQEFSTILKDKLGNHIKKIILFGSRARGDFDSKKSDYDFLIVVDIDNKALRDCILNIEVDFLNKYEELLTTIIYDEKEWEFNKYVPLGLNILKEGITL